MLLSTLRQVHKRLDALGPPWPASENAATWTNAPKNFKHVPLVERWDAPDWVPRAPNGGLVLAPGTLLFQRGYGTDSDLRTQFASIECDRFNGAGTLQECLAFEQKLSFDFLVYVYDFEQDRVAAGCMVELHCTNGDEIPYLFISNLCTDRTYGGQGLAHLMVHAVHALGALLLLSEKSVWAIPQHTLYLALTVHHTPQSDDAVRLVRLYSQCGLATREMNPQLPVIDYPSFTPYSLFQWRLEHYQHYTAMWKCITPHVIYEDANGQILHPTCDGIPLHYTFPASELQLAQAHGLVHAKQANLHRAGTVHVAAADIIFRPSAVTSEGRFSIQADRLLLSTEFAIRISIPAWFARSIACQS